MQFLRKGLLIKSVLLGNCLFSSYTFAAVIGNIDGFAVNPAGETVLSGWMCEQGNANSIWVNFYAGGIYGIGTAVTSANILANQPSEPAVASACKTSGSNYRFAIPMAADVPALFANLPIYIYGISTDGQSGLLLGSGIYTVPVVAKSALPTPPLDTNGHPVYPVYAASLGIIPNTGTDVSSAMNSALASLQVGQILVLESGTYIIGNTLLLHSGTGLYGSSDSSSTIGARIIPTATIPNTPPFGSPVLLMNLDHAPGTDIDSGLAVLGVTFDNGTLLGSNGVTFVGVTNALIKNSRFNGGGDGSAMLESSNTTVSSCLATNTHNAGFDHWDGTNSAVVENSTVIAGCGYGILFNSTSTDYQSRSMQNVSAIGNSISGLISEAGIFVAPLSAGSILSGVTLSGNTITSPTLSQVIGSQCGQVWYTNQKPTLAGVAIQGAQYVTLENQLILNAAPSLSISAGPDSFQHPITNLVETYNLSQIYRDGCPAGTVVSTSSSALPSCNLEGGVFKLMEGSLNANSAPLYNCTRSNGDIFTSLKSDCENAGSSPQLIGYVGTKESGPLSIELYRCVGSQSHLTTAYPSLECTTATGFKVEGPLGWVSP